MPGLNQLKQFSEDIRAVGDEVKIRAQRGEKVPILPLPQGISEADDSDEFIIGLPDKDATAAKQEDAEELGSIDDILGTSSASAAPSADELAGLDSDIAALLNPQAAADEDALADFLNDDNPASVTEPAPAEPLESEEIPSEPETPLEDLDLDSLLAPAADGADSGDAAPVSEPEVASEPEIPASDTSSASEPSGDFADLGDALSNLGDLTDLGASGDFAADASPADEGAVEAVPADDVLSAESPSADFDTLSELGDLDSPAGAETPAAADSSLDLGSFDIDSLIGGDSSSADSSAGAAASEPSEPVPEVPSDMADFGDLGDLGELSDFGSADSDSAAEPVAEAPSADEIPSVDEAPLSEEPSAEAENAEPASDGAADSSADDLGSLDDFGSLDAPASDSTMELGSFDIDSLVSDSDGAGSDAPSEIPDAMESVPGGEEELSFDTSGMEDVDFGPSEPSASSSGDEFPATDDSLGGGDDDDFILDSSFEIPGFSDTDTADMGKKKPLLDTVDFSKGKEGIPRNSLTEPEYEQFKKNLANYPLNLRIALEDFISRDEFTDEAVFEIIEKVLKKTSARQLATQLEKILDISINIPRDFERRSFAEYEAYKQSFQYQLKNRIIPAAIVGVILAFVCFGLFKAGEFFIYKPVMANIHYKQGYTLLEANEFPQSEQEFQEAVSYKPVKKWFYKYAQGYRIKKQYERAGQMYKRILAFFNHDKQAGLEYAEMELYERANYERAEEIVRREVLDYHINDADGILLLGDVFLEWAEVEPSKYELAKEQYLDLLQRYGSNNVYLSRMLRYNIRTDKLRDVLTYKNMFYVSKQDKQNLKNLSASDWTELSGYLLEKLYGKLSKNDEYLRSSIEDVLAMLNLAIKADPSNPVARYNLARYFIQNGNTEQAKVELERSLDLFGNVVVRTKKNVFREINATRTLGELYASAREYLKAQTVYTRGINLYNEEHEASGLEGTEDTGKLFADMGDLDYFISGELDDALYNYEKAIEIKYDIPSINYRVGAIYYNRKNYDNALASFIKVAEKEPRDPNILLSLGNVLSLRGDNFAAESYYSDLLRILDTTRDPQKFLLPQEDEEDFATVDLYLKSNNNLGVTLYRLANQTGDSKMNAEAIVRLSDSMRAYDALTRNPKTMIRMEGSNLAAQNSKYITHPYPDFEPAIYTDIPRLLAGEKGLE